MKHAITADEDGYVDDWQIRKFQDCHPSSATRVYIKSECVPLSKLREWIRSEEFDCMDKITRESDFGRGKIDTLRDLEKELLQDGEKK